MRIFKDSWVVIQRDKVTRRLKVALHAKPITALPLAAVPELALA